MGGRYGTPFQMERMAEIIEKHGVEMRSGRERSARMAGGSSGGPRKGSRNT